jgi:hypothetical protein
MEMIAMLNGLGGDCAGCGMAGVPRTGSAWDRIAQAGQIASGQYVSDQVKLQRASMMSRQPITPEQAAFFAKSGQISSSQYSPRLAAAPMPARDYEMVANRSIASGQWLAGAPMSPMQAMALAQRGQMASTQYNPRLAGLGAVDGFDWKLAGGIALGLGAIYWLAQRA